MKSYSLVFTNNQTWQWTRDLSAFLQTYALSGAVLRFQIYRFGASVPSYKWVTPNAPDAGATNGSIALTISGSTATMVTSAPLSDMETLVGTFRGEFRAEFSNGTGVDLFSVMVTATAGNTTYQDAARTGTTGIGDTVIVVGELDPAPVPLPLGLTAAVGAAAGYASAANNSASAASASETAALNAVANFVGLFAGASLTLDYSQPGYSIVSRL